MKANRRITGTTISGYDPAAQGATQQREVGQPTNTRHDPVIYYMRMDRLVKIGTTRNILGRVGTIMPQGVLAVEPGGNPRERDRHWQFQAFHSHLEWYWLREPLWEHIQQLRGEAPKLLGATVEEWLRKNGVRNGNNFADDDPEFDN